MRNLSEMTEEIVKIFSNYEKQGTKPWTFDVASHDLQYQVGSVAKCVLQLKNFRYAEGLSEDVIKTKLADELADIMAEVLFIAHELHIDIEEAWGKMIESDLKKIEQRSGNTP